MFFKKIGHGPGCPVRIVTEGVVFAVDEMELAVKVDALIPLAVGIRGNDVTRAVKHVGRSLVLRSRFINGKGLGRFDIIGTDLIIPYLNSFRRIEGVVVKAEKLTANSIFPQNRSRCHEGQGLDLLCPPAVMLATTPP